MKLILEIEDVIGRRLIDRKGRRLDAEKDAGKMLSHPCALACFEEIIRGMILIETFGSRKEHCFFYIHRQPLALNYTIMYNI